jgi:hypothetical protein
MSYEEAGVYRRGESAKSVLSPDFSIEVAAVSTRLESDELLVAPRSRRDALDT